jgi:hypothetical protein
MTRPTCKDALFLPVQFFLSSQKHRRPGWFRVPGGWATGVKDRKSANAEHIKLTLQRLKEKAESSGGAAPAATSS